MDYSQTKRALFDTCKDGGSGDEKKVNKILEAYPSLKNEGLDSYGCTALILATKYNHFKVIELLRFDESININQQEKGSKWTALHWASYSCKKEVTELLLSHYNITVDIPNNYWQFPRDICCDGIDDKSNKSIILEMFENYREAKATSTFKTTTQNSYVGHLPNFMDIFAMSQMWSSSNSALLCGKLGFDKVGVVLIIFVFFLPFVISSKNLKKTLKTALASTITPPSNKATDDKEDVVLSDQIPKFEDRFEAWMKRMKNSQTELPIKLDKKTKRKKKRSLEDERLPLMMKALPLLPLPLPPNKQTHVFLTHTWREDEKGRNNHDRVGKVNEALQKRGLVTWFDSEMMKGTVRQAMTDALGATCCVLIFITKKYEEKVNSADEADNCYFEFNVTAHDPSLANMRIPIVMEECMLNARNWQGRLKAEMGHQLYFDLSSDGDEEFLGKQSDKVVRRVVELLKERYLTGSFDSKP